MTKIGLVKSTGVIGLATGISRILGFIRDIIIAHLFGTAVYAQAFVVAFRIPNLLRDLIGEGATNAAFVPVLTEELAKKGKVEFFKLAQVIFNILFWVLLALSLLGVLSSGLIVKIIAPGFLADKEKFELTVTLTRMLFPFLLLVGLWAYAMGVLNSLEKFASPAFGPCVLNVAVIACAAYFGENVFGLTAGVLIGGLSQLLIQFPSLYASGWRMAITTQFRHPQAKKVGILLIPRALGACVYQVNVFIGTILASLSSVVGEGAVAGLYYANRIWQLPLAIFGIALAQAALPSMSKHVALDNMDKMRDTLLFSLRILFFILIPSSIGLVVLSTPIVKVLFERGAFTSYSTRITSSALVFYSIGLVGSGGIKILANAFYSLRDTMTPVKTAAFSVLVNLVLNLVLMRPLKIGGLALATSIASTLNFVILYIMLDKRVGGLGTRHTAESFIKATVAGMIMAAFLKLLLFLFPDCNAFGLFAMIFTGIATFAVSSYFLNVKELKDLLAWIAERR